MEAETTTCPGKGHVENAPGKGSGNTGTLPSSICNCAKSEKSRGQTSKSDNQEPAINQETGETCCSKNKVEDKGQTPKVEKNSLTGKGDEQLCKGEKMDVKATSPKKGQSDQQSESDGDVVGAMPAKTESGTNGPKENHHNGEQGRQYTRALSNKVKMSIRVDETEPDWDTIDIPFEKREVTVKKRWIDKDYEVKEFLGSGKFGEVKACVEKSTGKDFAAKFISTYSQDDKKGVMTEVEVMKKLQHPRLLQLYDVYDSSDKRNEMCLILELISGGELFERVVDDDFFLTERACMMFVKQIIDGVAYMHSMNVLHLDLKPENILCLTKKGNAIKIIDFGLAHFFDPKKKLMVLAGTPEFVAPEVVKYEGVSHATDMWSVGVICYVLLSGLSPFMGDSDMETLGNVTACDWSFDFKEFEEISDTAKDFISRLLVADPKKRMTSEESSKHAWLQTSTPMPAAKIDKARLKRFLIRRKWQKAVNAILALSRMGVHLSKRSVPGREN